ncbi:hypothetical protein VULLAG_LOCUS23188 [Vulpes lagopus]
MGVTGKPGGQGGPRAKQFLLLQPACSLHPGAWSLEPGACSLEPGAWSLQPGACSRSLEPGAWSLQPAARSPEPGAQSPPGGTGSREPRHFHEALAAPALGHPSAVARYPSTPKCSSQGRGGCGAGRLRRGGAGRWRVRTRGPHKRGPSRGATGPRTSPQTSPEVGRHKVAFILLQTVSFLQGPLLF